MTVRRVLIIFQEAPSSKTRVVDSLISDSAPAHHARQRQRTGLVADQHGEIIQGTLDIVQGDQFFTLASRPGDDGGCCLPGGCRPSAAGYRNRRRAAVHPSPSMV